MKQVLRMVMFLGGVLVLLSALSLQISDAHAAPSSGQGSQRQLNSASCGTWKVVQSPNGNGSSGLNSLAVVSAHAIWAVGNVSDPMTRVQTTLIEFWNGTAWHIVSNPNPSPRYNTLYSVTAVSANDVWAVGFAADSVSIAQTLIEHWNGSSWSVVTSPNVGSEDNELFSVAAVSARDVWAVGFAATSTGGQIDADRALERRSVAGRAQPQPERSSGPFRCGSRLGQRCLGRGNQQHRNTDPD